MDPFYHSHKNIFIKSRHRHKNFAADTGDIPGFPFLPPLLNSS